MIAALAPFALIALCAVPWVILVGRRFGHILGALTVLAGVPLVVLVCFHVSQPLGTDPVWVVLAASAVGGLVGLGLLVRHRPLPSRPGRAAIAAWLSSCAGLLAWVSTLAIAPLVGGSIRGWAMFGDAANNIRISRDMLENHGYPLTQLQAVPIPNELLAIAGWAGRGGTRGELLAHDLYALAAFGALAIGATGMLIGMVASSLIGHHPRRAAVVAALASLACTTWFVAGLPMESGYFNVHVVLPFALASWLAFLQSRRHPVASVVALGALMIVILASWSPLAVLPSVFALAVLLRHRDSPRMPRGALPLALVGALSIAAIVVVATQSATIASFVRLLASPGHGFPTTIPVLAVASAVSGAAVLIGRSAVGRHRGDIAALGVAVAVGLAVLLSLNSQADVPWLAYYPAKYTWLVSVVVVAVAVSLLVRVLDGLPPARATAASAALLILALGAATLGPAPLRENFRIEQPLARILTDSVLTTGERAVDTIIEYDSRPDIVFQWATGTPDEAFINFWALEFKGAGPDGGHGDVRIFTVYAYRELRDTGSYRPRDVEGLCDVVESLGGVAEVHTRESSLADQLTLACPDLDITVVVDPRTSE